MRGEDSVVPRRITTDRVGTGGSAGDHPAIPCHVRLDTTATQALPFSGAVATGPCEYVERRR